MTSRSTTGRRWKRPGASGLLPQRSRWYRGQQTAYQFDQARPYRDGSEIWQRHDRNADLATVPHHAPPVDDDAAAGNRHQRHSAEPAEQTRPTKNGAVVQTTDHGTIIAAIEVLPHKAQAVEVESVLDHGARLVEHSRALRAKLVEEEVTAAVAGDARIQRMRQKHLPPERHIMEIESGR